MLPPVPPPLHELAGGIERLLTVRQVAQRLGVCAATVYKLCALGRLRHVRVVNVIRVVPADLETFVVAGGRG